MDQDLQKKILDSFPNAKLVGIKREYTAGQSGSPVFAAHYSQKNKYGLEGTFIVKIGPVSWANEEEARYNNLSKSAFSSLLAHFHMLSNPVEGQAAVAYDVAFGSLLTPQSLMNILDDGVQNEATTQKHIEQLVQPLVDGYLNGNFNTVVEDQHTLLLRMLTERRAHNLLERLTKTLPFWHASSSQIIVEGIQQLLPNPLFYMNKRALQKIPHSPVCPVSYIHGDLHTGNVIYTSSLQTPKIIDFEYSTENGVPFFDLAYLEFDIIRHLLPVEREENRLYWLALLDISMAKIEGRQKDIHRDARRTWEFIQPIRQGVQRLQPVTGEDHETIWWLSTVAVGLNFARKGEPTRSQFERMAGLLYAAYGLARLLEIFNVKEPTTEQPIFVPWIRGMDISLPPLESPTSSRQELPHAASSTEGSLSAPIELSPDTGKAIFHPSPLEAHLAQDLSINSESAAEQFQDTVASPPEKHSIEPPHQSEKEQGAASGNFPMGVAENLQKLLEEAVNRFNEGRRIYQNECNTIDSTLQQLESYLQAMLNKSTAIPVEVKLSLQNIVSLQKEVRSILRSFRGICPPTTKNLSEAQYKKELDATRKKLEELSRDFLELLKELP